MATLIELAPAVFLLTIIFFIPLLAVYFAGRSWLFTRHMKSLAYELVLNYSRPLALSPPTVNGFYKGRDVVVDYADGCTRFRAFHSGEVPAEFTVASAEYFTARNIPGSMRFDTSNAQFANLYRVTMGSDPRVRKYLDENLQSQALQSGISFKVGPFDVSCQEKGRIWDKGRIIEVLDFLMLAAGRADHY
ncbi:MAG: hypothetical protein V1875_08910 [Candidatus Altiarchaeota archaeon]